MIELIHRNGISPITMHPKSRTVQLLKHGCMLLRVSEEFERSKLVKDLPVTKYLPLHSTCFLKGALK